MADIAGPETLTALAAELEAAATQEQVKALHMHAVTWQADAPAAWQRSAISWPRPRSVWRCWRRTGSGGRTTPSRGASGRTRVDPAPVSSRASTRAFSLGLAPTQAGAGDHIGQAARMEGRPSRPETAPRGLRTRATACRVAPREGPAALPRDSLDPPSAEARQAWKSAGRVAGPGSNTHRLGGEASCTPSHFKRSPRISCRQAQKGTRCHEPIAGLASIAMCSAGAGARRVRSAVRQPACQPGDRRTPACRTPGIGSIDLLPLGWNAGLGAGPSC